MIIIPARLASTRFPSKILSDIGGVPMFIKSAQNAAKVGDVVLALDSNETMKIAEKFGIKAVLTNPNIPNGSLRCLEASRILGLKSDEIIINLQADEPFLESSVIQALQDCMQKDVFMATCAKVIDYKSALSPNIVKVVLDSNSNAIYFSRALIPHHRDFEALLDSKNLIESSFQTPKIDSKNSLDSNNLDSKNTPNFLGHLGLYGYFKESLEEISNLKECELENIEKLEQLRAIYYNKKIKVAIVESQSIGIDTQEDLESARKIYGF
ncbi:3-deoxy-manno-octulosonate cytidylyltransferase [Helicobacter saguini]|uniref:3-deoxy-manno-octulosonate cytidylyltransferase n=1 Tax=Helicobacter saguini TaxID=1548018 RepID=A0A347VT55_9HELI|nr:3-deoxy-manno-octulosonate cytidylyltransferase [Helicobacter saguini]MWV62232.1 3-deoxy-manno-octulosonate cytidylyltransferase [Helicobacter saguini]MWV67095.1 3-deoxy-manno-octulosonate cytidylyltransferase [Helicobacter saguini]MWV69445.1 3-deoxy-manno-octulosonate cytidylyltransferase [Helicobacter saguini]MWV71002.1 3-deoxy-manno-octulosonate cytidylyltransferase [Helicobacter saguini]TLD92915.1 3-deoxy-manno-octulosonate cytidylyltransferase [Helicobacter saguini]